MSFPVVKLPADRTCIVTGANTGVLFLFKTTFCALCNCVCFFGRLLIYYYYFSKWIDLKVINKR